MADAPLDPTNPFASRNQEKGTDPIKEAVLAERQACAQIAQDRESEGGEYGLAARHIARAIRARSTNFS